MLQQKQQCSSTEDEQQELTNTNDSTTSSSSSSLQRRIIIASSMSQCNKIKNCDIVSSYNNMEKQYNGHISYSESKLLDAMLTIEFANRLSNYHTNNIICHCLDPGTVNTKMLYAGWGPCGIHVNDALDETWLCTTDSVIDVTGKYYINRKEYKASVSAYDTHERMKLWSILSELVPDAASIWNFDSI